MPPLAGKNIVLVGCGSLGGFLARALAQLGAGRDGGSLILIDDEALTAGNVGRHVLGVEAVGLGKAESCRDLILRDFPGASVRARTRKIQTERSLLATANLVIDATGEQAIGEMLNAWMLEGRAERARFPDVLHVWIEGRGAAVQSFVSSDPMFGCFRCLDPVRGEHSRFGPLKNETANTLEGGCGETVFTPYGPAAPMAASALAVQHAADWAAGRARPLLRTVRLDYDGTRDIKPTNPTTSDRCPACRTPLSLQKA